MNFIAPKEIPSLEQLLAERSRRWKSLPPDLAKEKREALALLYRKQLEHFEQIELLVKAFGEECRPIDQGRIPAQEERKTAKYRDMRWSFVNRWPWIAATSTTWDVSNPPWHNLAGRSFHDAVKHSLIYCLKNHQYLPKTVPGAGRSIFGFCDESDDLPLLYTVGGRFIPPGIVDKYQEARCGEALAFVWSINGGDEMSKIRQLIASPSFERVAEAWAIATDKKILRERLKEHFIQEIEPEIKNLYSLQYYQSLHPQLLESPGPLAVLRAMLKDHERIWSARQLADEAGIYFRSESMNEKTARTHLAKLVNAEIAEVVGASTNKRWRIRRISP
jgi:hypothetical protein